MQVEPLQHTMMAIAVALCCYSAKAFIVEVSEAHSTRTNAGICTHTHTDGHDLQTGSPNDEEEALKVAAAPVAGKDLTAKPGRGFVSLLPPPCRAVTFAVCFDLHGHRGDTTAAACNAGLDLGELQPPATHPLPHSKCRAHPKAELCLNSTSNPGLTLKRKSLRGYTFWPRWEQ